MQNGDVIALASSYMSYANIIIVVVLSVATLVIAGITIGLMMYHSRDRKRLIEEATRNILEKIADNEQMRNDFINKILKDNNFRQDIERMMNAYIDNKMGKLVDEKHEQSSIEGLR